MCLECLRGCMCVSDLSDQFECPRTGAIDGGELGTKPRSSGKIASALNH